MKHKKLGILFVLLFCAAGTFAQCWVTPQYKDSVCLANEILRNNNFSESVYFSGNGRITNSVNFNNWTALGFNGSIIMEQTINYNSPTQKVYVNGSLELQNVSMSGGDSMFVEGSLIIRNINSNNSGNHNTIILSNSSSLIVNGKPAQIGDTVKLTDNPSNYLYIVGCSQQGGTTLPIKLKSFSIKNNTLNWAFENKDDIKTITVQGSNDGKNWSDVEELSSSTTSFSVSDTAKTASLIFLAPLMLFMLFGKVRNKFAKAFSFLFISTLLFFSCSKNDAVTNSDKATSYEMYRLKITSVDGTAPTYSDIVVK